MRLPERRDNVKRFFKNLLTEILTFGSQIIKQKEA